MSSKTKVLFFIDGPIPTAEQVKLADTLSSTRQVVCFRNAQQVTKDDSPEKCDFVCGDVPALYAKVPLVGQMALPLTAGPAPTAATAAESTPAPAPVATPSPEPAAVVEPPAPTIPPLPDNASNAVIKAALDERGIAYPKTANKAALLALYNQ